MNDARLETALDAFESALGERPNVVGPLDSMSNAAWRVALRNGEAVLRPRTVSRPALCFQVRVRASS